MMTNGFFSLTLFISSPRRIQSSLGLRKTALCLSWGAEYKTTTCLVSGLPIDLLIFCAQNFMCLSTLDVYLWKSIHDKNRFISSGEYVRLFGNIHLSWVTCSTHLTSLFRYCSSKQSFKGQKSLVLCFRAGVKSFPLQWDILVDISISAFFMRCLLLHHYNNQTREHRLLFI